MALWISEAGTSNIFKKCHPLSVQIRSVLPIYSHNEKFPPNRSQFKALRDFAIEAGYEKVEWDGGDKDDILWSVHDTLEEMA